MKKLNNNIKRKYSISEYNPEWISKFEIIKSSILEIFSNKALKIEHVGSTSIPGMKSKPLIDILIIVGEIKDLEKETLKMVNIGYEYVENYIAQNTLLFFKISHNQQKLENIHVCEEGAPKARQFLVMRNFLKMFPKKAKEYSDLKETNFQKYPNDYPAYRDAKTDFLQQIEKEAYEWEESNK